uniref:MYB transcription factor n=1 Tax=Ananas comosus var. bracteatus TaxID=296719 RepID=A0A6V7P0I4_ANACO|nr:unnamed protein product [Ananas comosus var. bracteatus]
MGAPKQKWTAEEEAALKAGVVKHGSGKWRTILKDPEFSGILCSRSNVDLKDKWRNLSVTASGWGSREKARLALKRSLKNSKHDDNSTATFTVDQGFDDQGVDDEIVDAKPLAMSSEPLKIEGPKRSFSRLEDLILEAIMSLKEPAGSNKTALATYIEDRYLAPADFKLLLSTKLKALTASGKLIKVKRKYRIPPSTSSSGGRNTKFLHLGGTKRKPSLKTGDVIPLAKPQADVESAQIKKMTIEEAAAAAARAVAEAEIAIAEAEEAAREAEAAEAEAEDAQAFAEAARSALLNRNRARLVYGP